MSKVVIERSKVGHRIFKLQQRKGCTLSLQCRYFFSPITYLKRRIQIMKCNKYPMLLSLSLTLVETISAEISTCRIIRKQWIQKSAEEYYVLRLQPCLKIELLFQDACLTCHKFPNDVNFFVNFKT